MADTEPAVEVLPLDERLGVLEQVVTKLRAAADDCAAVAAKLVTLDGRVSRIEARLGASALVGSTLGYALVRAIEHIAKHLPEYIAAITN